jgi:hypothetical protein
LAIIISDKKKSVIPGSMYLHESIPGVTAVYPENSVQYIRMGTAEGYCEKVYGEAERETGWTTTSTSIPAGTCRRATTAFGSAIRTA